MKKLTLTADEKVIDAARRYADEHGTSISALFSRFVLALTAEQSSGSPTLSRKSLTRKMSGIISVPKDAGDEDLLGDALADKYGIGS